MVLDNYVNWMTGRIFSSNLLPNNPYIFSLKDMQGRTMNFSNQSTDINTLVDGSNVDYGNAYVAVGSNDAPVQRTDYTFDSKITTLQLESYSHGVKQKGDKQVLRIAKTVSNPTSEDIVVKEIAFIVKVNPLGPADEVLMVREVLDEPITVKANGGIQVFGIDIG